MIHISTALVPAQLPPMTYSEKVMLRERMNYESRLIAYKLRNLDIKLRWFILGRGPFEN